jgi:MtaA/CmuA family methyltransferase
MAYAGVLDDVRRCVRLQVPERLPVMALTEEFDVGQAGLTYEEYAANADNVAKAHIQAIEDFGYDWACIYIDDCIEFEPLGVETVGRGNIPRSALTFLPAAAETVRALRIPDPCRAGRMPILLEAIAKVRERVGDSAVICGRSPAPFSAAALLFGVQTVMMLIYDNPALLRDAMGFLMDAAEVFARAQIEAGAHALWVGDCSASSRFISPSHFMEFAAAPAAEHLARLKRLGALTIYFAAEKQIPHLDAMCGLGADIIGLGEDANLAECKAAVGDRACLMGNLDPINVLLNGTPEIVEAEVRRIVGTACRSGGHLFNTGEGVPRATPVENVRAMVRALRESVGLLHGGR